MGRSKWLLLLLIPMLFGFDTAGPFRTRGPFKVADFTIGGGSSTWIDTFGPCTKGTNCFCDRVQGNGPQGTSDPIYNTNVFFCEDFDHDALWSENPVDPGSHGNWASSVADIYSGNNRGNNSYWRHVYGREGNLIPNGQPSVPNVGAACSIGFPCDQVLEWRSDNLFVGNYSNNAALIDIIRPGEFDDENGSSDLTIPQSDGATVFGNALLGARVPAGQTGGTFGTSLGNDSANTSDFGGTRAQFGITAAVGYESNLLTSGILATAWKHDEFKATRNGDVQDGLFGFRNTNISQTVFPYHFVVSTGAPSYYPDCNDGVAAGTAIKGGKSCQGNDSLLVYPLSADYTFTGSWSINAPHCMSVYWDFRTINSVTMKAWFDGALIVHVTGLDFSGSMADATSGTDGYSAFAFNNYANANANQGLPPTTVSTRRYMDNYVMREGTPVLCENIGFPQSYHQSGL